MNPINRQTVVAALIGMAVPLLCVLAINTYGRGKGAEARSVSETRIVAAADVPAMGAPASLAWQAPEGWTDAGTKGLRVANFAIGAAGEAECYITVLGGTGGGVAMNVNRWRAQIGLPEATEEEISALPKMAMLGVEAVLVELEGTYGGTSDGVHTSGESRESYKLLGAIAQRPNDAVFVKMTGPASVLAGEREKFIALVGSIRDSAVSTGAAGEHECCNLEH